jgi:hypothetical protein
MQANWLRQDAGVGPGDTVTIYMPMGPEIVITMVSGSCCVKFESLHGRVKELNNPE